MGFDPISSIHPRKRDELLSRPEIKQRLLVMDVIAGAFLTAAIVYLWIVSAGVLGEPREPETGIPIWYILVFVAISMVPLMIVMGAVFLNRTRTLVSGMAVLEQGQQLLIIELAIGEAVAIYGLIGVFLGAPKSAQYGLIGFGIVLMVAAVLALRGKVIELALVRLAEEEARRDR